MKRGRKIALISVLIIWTILLGFTFYYLSNVYNSINNPSQNNIVSEANSLIEITENQLVNGIPITIEVGDVIPITIDTNDYTLKIYEINQDNIKFITNNFLYFSVKQNINKKLDISGDNYYDILIKVEGITDNTAEISFQKITEKQNIGGNMAELLNRFEEDQKTQSRIITLTLLIAGLILLFYIIKSYFIPTIKNKRKMARKTEKEAFDDLFDKCIELIKEGNKEQAKKVYKKLNHLYKYMPEKKKKKIEKYLK
jgi:hypothetical protein